MKITILEAGRAPGQLADLFPSYPDMFVRLLSGIDAALTFETVRVLDGAPLPDPEGLDAALITGSPSGVYDQTPWMDPLREFIRGAHQAKTPLAGVCFGHQVMADALGGDVRKSPKGWGVGRHTYDILQKRSWMTDAGSAFSLAVSHQDQVIAPPPGAATLASSKHTDHAMLHWHDAPMMSVQGHPEFDDAFVSALYGARRGLSLSDEMADAAIESLRQPEDSSQVGEWIVRFLTSARAG
jgi:GMP synthase-like glutamine amidotransferase